MAIVLNQIKHTKLSLLMRTNRQMSLELVREKRATNHFLKVLEQSTVALTALFRTILVDHNTYRQRALKRACNYEKTLQRNGYS